MNTLERIAPAIGKLAAKTSTSRGGTACLEIEPRDARAVIARLRDAAQFETCTFVTAVDHFPAEPRFEVVWQLHSIAHGDRVRIRARVGGAEPKVPTIVDLYPGAAYGERECFDMFGVVFQGHPGLKRLLMPEEYDHFPLRKDFPHQGIEPDRLYREWDRARHLKSPEAAQ
jgi:NADH-quinone oxidoreductase subunit C